MDIPKDFILDGQNYLTYTILAGQTVQVFVRYNQAKGQQGGDIPQLPADAGVQDNGKKLLFKGWLNSRWKIEFMDLKDIIG